MKILNDDKFQLSSGRTISANRLIIGLSPEDDIIYEGYDGAIPLCQEDLTADEKIEIAGYMIELWIAFWKRVQDGEKETADQTG